jgi:hypothetical protein
MGEIMENDMSSDLPMEHVLNAAEVLAELQKRGDFVSLVVVGIAKDGKVWSCGAYRNYIELLGMLSNLEHDMRHSKDTKTTYEDFD